MQDHVAGGEVFKMVLGAPRKQEDGAKEKAVRLAEIFHDEKFNGPVYGRSGFYQRGHSLEDPM